MANYWCTAHLYPIDGAPSRVGSDEMARVYRDAVWAQVIAGVDPDPANASVIRDWAVSYSDVVRPHTLGTGVREFPDVETGDRRDVRRSYDRLARNKGHYDPGGLGPCSQSSSRGYGWMPP